MGDTELAAHPGHPVQQEPADQGADRQAHERAGAVRNEPRGRNRIVSLRREDLDAAFPGLLDAVLDGEGTA